jgi:phosphoglycerate dehydrogenase-like enzyme
MIPSKDALTICFAHVAYQLQQQFAARNTGLASFQVADKAELERRLPEADVLVVSGLWNNGLPDLSPRLRFIQSVSAGVDQYDKDKLRQHGIRLASAQGANARAVSEHAMALVLALSRRLPEARDNQAKKFWRGMIGDLTRREDELGGKTMLIVGIGRIGGRLAQLAKAFDLRVIGVRRQPQAGNMGADEIHGFDALPQLLPQADYVVLTCPLTPETEKLIDAAAFARMKPSAYLVNVARGRCVDEPALVDALRSGQIAAAGIDVTVEEPLPPSSPLWALENAFVTPHTAGETRRYEDNVIDLLLENLQRLWRGEAELRNQVV